MINRRARGTNPFLLNSPVQIWTVVSRVQDRVSCSIHPSEYQAYREATSRFESAELGAHRKDTELKKMLENADACGDYQEVRKYIEDKSCHLQFLQLTEHSVDDLWDYQAIATQLPQNPVLHASS